MRIKELRRKLRRKKLIRNKGNRKVHQVVLQVVHQVVLYDIKRNSLQKEKRNLQAVAVVYKLKRNQENKKTQVAVVAVAA